MMLMPLVVLMFENLLVPLVGMMVGWNVKTMLPLRAELKAEMKVVALFGIIALWLAASLVALMAVWKVDLKAHLKVVMTAEMTVHSTAVRLVALMAALKADLMVVLMAAL